MNEFEQRLNQRIINNIYYRRMLKVCKYCKHFTDLGKKVKSYKRHRCDKKQSTIYEAYFCEKTDALRGELEMSI